MHSHTGLCVDVFPFSRCLRRLVNFPLGCALLVGQIATAADSSESRSELCCPSELYALCSSCRPARHVESRSLPSQKLVQKAGRSRTAVRRSPRTAPRYWLSTLVLASVPLSVCPPEGCPVGSASQFWRVTPPG